MVHVTPGKAGKPAPGASAPQAEQVQQLLQDITDKRNEVDEKLTHDINLKEDLQRQLMNLAEELENCEDRLSSGKRQRRRLDLNLAETESAIQKLEETAKKLGATMQKMRKKGAS